MDIDVAEETAEGQGSEGLCHELTVLHMSFPV